MSNSFYEWKPEYLDSFVGITSVSIGFIIFWFIIVSSKIKSLFFSKYQEEKAWINYVVFQKIMGVLFLGIIPGVLVLFYYRFHYQIMD
ncbi:MAG: hypothetical protein NTX97_13415 [Bacteroidetes bacterium]|nr:hypothetical protein [Bacteroidota bacterium]